MALTKKTNLQDMQIGDYIPCRYTAPVISKIGYFSELGTCTANEIYTNGETLPDGLFNFIKVDKGLLVADRVVQASIPWSELNLGKMIEGKPLNYNLIKQNVSSLTTGLPSCIAFSPDGVYMAISQQSAPFINIYKRDGDTFNKLVDPTILPTGLATGVAFSPDGIYMTISHSTTPFITIYKRDGDIFNKLTDPASLPPGDGKGISFSGDGGYVSIVHTGTPYATIYKRTEDVFTKLVNPVSVSTTSYGACTAFSPDGIYLAIGYYSSPYISIYKRNGDTFTKLTDLSSANGLPKSVKFSPDGSYLAITGAGALGVYKRNGDTFNKLPVPIKTIAGDGNGVCFSPDGKYIAVSHITTPYISLFIINNDILDKVDDPIILPSGNGYAIGISPDGKYIITGNNNAAMYSATYINSSIDGMIRSLSGGCAYTDDDNNSYITDQSKGAYPNNNEWDKYIVNSDLNGVITKGDNNIWNWNVTPASWMEETPILSLGTSNLRISRGSNTGTIKTLLKITSTTANTSYGFRPVLEYLEDNADAQTLFY